ncbi:DUF742 domain-containing protein [Carbonactinospora thermoautotrophica]|uniref:DUF742 domain-containing protein n=1 Tax=Carbonactinospora thermoautotrophica TaxID=1469144 RepID=A0A132N6P5_9ACTN|nr:DUF742 domain-containing protein [Carbonactinospora thermoautotrophica]KWX05667.1 hypothetical protein TH66_00990 [Carbonactinospora thermoautotrophica]KWX09663.1 hypothetical protein TR74_08225 [Carbonactinospora thermoautotrophica]MCX9192846.1 DUF742 domain-containing protein [Carbonactinospora thermoautotrophica]
MTNWTNWTDESWFDEATGRLVRPYAVTGGRTRPARDEFSLITLVITADPEVDTSRLEPEPAAILDLCRQRPLSVAEIAAYLDLPVSVVKILLGDLLDNAMIVVRTSAPMANGPDLSVLEAVIDGIRKL